jgi:hypothetical protein
MAESFDKSLRSLFHKSFENLNPPADEWRNRLLRAAMSLSHETTGDKSQSSAGTRHDLGRIFGQAFHSASGLKEVNRL